MALYRFIRSPFGCQRFSRWWKAALAAYDGSDLGEALTFMSRTDPAPEWVCSDVSYESALPLLAKIDGWEWPDGLGHPLLGLRLSPKEERLALQDASPSLRKQLAPECNCPPDAPRKNRRIAEAAWQKYVRDRERAYEAAQRSASGSPQ